MDDPNADILPLEPFMQDGVEAQPIFEVDGAVTRESYRGYIVKLYWPGSRVNLWLLGIAGLMMFLWGLFDTVLLNYRSRILLCGIGFGLGCLILLQSRATKSAVERFGKDPHAFRLRFFEDGLEEYGNHSMARRPYSDIARIVFSGEDLHIYVVRSGVHIVSREHLSVQVDALIELLERKTGKAVVRPGAKQKQ